MSEHTPGSAIGAIPISRQPHEAPFDLRHSPRALSRRRTCVHQAGFALYVIIQANGNRAVVSLCKHCLRNESDTRTGVPHFWPHDRVQVDDLSIIADNRRPERACAHCGALGTEQHHWAPWHLFEDADSWPTSYLCVPCHRLWHRTIVGHRKIA